MLYLLNENNLIVKRLNENVDKKDIKFYQTDKQLDIDLSWNFNDYVCYRWKVKNKKLKENQIVLIPIVDENNLIIDVQTTDLFSIDDHNQILFNAENLPLKDEFEIPKYKIKNKKIISNDNINNDQQKQKDKIVNKRIETAIRKEFSEGQEIKYMKDYIEWQTGKRKTSDERYINYKKMVNDIAEIKGNFK